MSSIPTKVIIISDSHYIEQKSAEVMRSLSDNLYVKANREYLKVHTYDELVCRQ